MKKVAQVIKEFFEPDKDALLEENFGPPADLVSNKDLKSIVEDETMRFKLEQIFLEHQNISIEQALEMEKCLKNKCVSPKKMLKMFENKNVKKAWFCKCPK